MERLKEIDLCRCGTIRPSRGAADHNSDKLFPSTMKAWAYCLSLTGVNGQRVYGPDSLDRLALFRTLAAQPGAEP
jgi:hypothetical protein